MLSTVYVKKYAPPEINKKEILRYAGVRGDIYEINELMDECLKEAEGKLSYKLCYTELPVRRSLDVLDLSFTTVTSKDLSLNLNGCDRYILFLATLGIGIDRLIAKYNVVSPAKVIIMQAIGAERIEALCNLFNNEIIQKYKHTKPRFSPGYGDLPIEIQRDIVKLLDCYKNIGVSLNESLLMSPSKSVSAFIGISTGGGNLESKGCCDCDKRDCSFRRE